MQPDMVEWNSWHVLALTYAYKRSSTGLDDDIFQKMRISQEKDPENLDLAAHYLWQRAKRGESIEDEARELATKVLRSPVSYSGLKPLLWVYRKYISDIEAIDLAEEALKNHPDERYLKRRAALCYEKRLFFSDSPPTTSMLDRAVSLHQEIYRSSSEEPCLDVSHEKTVKDLMDTTIQSERRAERQWTYQTCTEFVFYQTCEDASCPFSGMVTLRSQTEICLELFGISQNSLLGRVAFTNHILSGNVGNRTDGGEEAESVFIRDSAHCADMSRGRVTDRRSLKNSRQEIEKHVESWLKTAQQEKRRSEDI
ncbi:hypothetical protein JOQ06_017141 [Pogonophryne albipinna]|uniref:Uncharacterized protein n=1 Tax=Pogonophryne albipinna TaxID=1090488 RepID=A0AAD6B3M6_9TELE|nr:hypothetical protein JOQ06_017141 [Pogonophryne albipinna]